MRRKPHTRHSWRTLWYLGLRRLQSQRERILGAVAMGDGRERKDGYLGPVFPRPLVCDKIVECVCGVCGTPVTPPLHNTSCSCKLEMDSARAVAGRPFVCVCVCVCFYHLFGSTLPRIIHFPIPAGSYDIFARYLSLGQMLFLTQRLRQEPPSSGSHHPFATLIKKLTCSSPTNQPPPPFRPSTPHKHVSKHAKPKQAI